MTYFESILLGLIQGLSEFLPISSSGHLTLMQHYFGIEESNVLIFTILLHVGTLISVFIAYRKDIWELILELLDLFKDVLSGKGLKINKNDNRRLGFLIIVATIPTILMGLFGQDLFKSFYSSMTAVGIGLIFTGTILFISEKIKVKEKTIMEMSFLGAIFVGICQGIAITPGVSRSGSTLFGSLMSGLDRKIAVKYAFLLSIPTILGSVVFEMPKALESGIDSSLILPILLGMAVASVSGLFAIKTMIDFVAKQKLKYFSYYTWILGICVIVINCF